jgi:hypothetical protein
VLGLADGASLCTLGNALGADDGGSVALGDRLGFKLGIALGWALLALGTTLGLDDGTPL